MVKNGCGRGSAKTAVHHIPLAKTYHVKKSNISLMGMDILL
jgi:hypothetical protein